MEPEILSLYDNRLFSTIKQLGDQSRQPYIILDTHFQPIMCNELFTQLTQYTLQDIQQLADSDWIVSNAEQELQLLKQELTQGVRLEKKLVHKRKDGTSFDVKLDYFPFQNEQQRTLFTLIFLEDLAYNKMFKLLNRVEKDIFLAIQQDLSFDEKLLTICQVLDRLLKTAGATTITLKKNNRWQVVRANQLLPHETIVDEQCVAYYNWCLTLEEIKMFTQKDFHVLPNSHRQFMETHALHQYAVVPLQNINGEKIGSIIFYHGDIIGECTHYYEMIRKVTDLILLIISYEEKEQQIYQLGYTDLPTGMLNLYGFMEAINSSGIVIGELQLIEMTEFSRIINIYGRDTGECLLKAIYERLLNKFSEKAVYIGRFTSTAIGLFTSKHLAERWPIEEVLQYLIAEPYVIDEIEIYITLKSGGVTINEQMKLNDAFRFADSALVEAREKSGTYSVFYNEEKEAQQSNELNMLIHLARAVKNKEITAFLQPKVELRKNRIISMEALARWISPTLGFVSPAEFIPIAEKAGLIREIDLQIIERVLQWFQQRQYKGKKIVPIAVNISPEHFYHPHFVEELQQLLHKYYADPTYLIIEITESLGLVDIERAQKIIEQLYVRGLKTSVDDFGVGYSSLSYLQKLLFSELKIDRSFTSRIHEVGTRAIVKSLVQIAHNLQMDVIAEGVETKEQAKLLFENGCTQAQGYYFYKPMSFEDVEKQQILD